MTALFLESNVGSSDDWYLLIGVLQFFVGVAQVIGAFFRTIVSFFDKTDRKKLAIYWIMVFAYFSIWELFLYCQWDIMIWIPFAWLIAIWYCLKIVFHERDSSKTIANY